MHGSGQACTTCPHPALPPGRPAQDEADALAACSTLARVWGLPAAAQRRATADLLRDAASSSWGAAFYAAGSLQDALAAVDDAAVRQELLESMGAMGPAAEADEQPPAPDEMLFDVLTQQALVLGAASAREAARAAAAAAEAARHRKAAERQQRQAAKLREQAAAAQLQVASAQQQVPERQHEAAVRAGAPAAPPPVVPAAAWDPTAEKLPLRHATPDWWLTLPVLHVPQLVYADGSKGLMSVRVRAPQAAGSPPASASNGSGSSGGGSGGGSSAEGAQVLVAFADGKDAEALADCLLTVRL